MQQLGLGRKSRTGVGDPGYIQSASPYPFLPLRLGGFA